MCEEDCERPGRGLNELDEDVGGVWRTCPVGQSYCLAVQACVTNCQFFDNDEDEGDEIEDEEEKCPNGTVSNIARCSLVMCFSVFCVCTLCELISFLTCNRIFCRVICSILTNWA